MDKVNGMKKKYMIAAAAVVLLVIVIAIVMGKGTSAKKVAELLDLGNKYLLEQDYEQAVVAFEKLIEIEPMNVDAYLGLAEAYVGMGNTEEAVAALEKGYELTGSEEILKKLEELQKAMEEPEEAAEEEPTGEAPQRSDAGVYQTIDFDGDTEKMIDSIIASCVDGQFEKARDMIEGDAFKNMFDQYGYLSEPSEYLKYYGIIQALHKEARVYMTCAISTNVKNWLFAYLPQSGTGFIVERDYTDESDGWGYVKGDVAGYSFNGAFYKWDSRDQSDENSPYIREEEGTLVDNCYEGRIIEKSSYNLRNGEAVEMYRLYENGRLVSLGDDPNNPEEIIIARETKETGASQSWASTPKESFRDLSQNRYVCTPCSGYIAPAPWEEVK